MKGFKDTTRVQYFKGGQVTREKACGGMVKKAEGGRITDPVKNKTGGKNAVLCSKHTHAGTGAPGSGCLRHRKR